MNEETATMLYYTLTDALDKSDNGWIVRSLEKEFSEGILTVEKIEVEEVSSPDNVLSKRTKGGLRKQQFTISRPILYAERLERLLHEIDGLAAQMAAVFDATLANLSEFQDLPHETGAERVRFRSPRVKPEYGGGEGLSFDSHTSQKFNSTALRVSELVKKFSAEPL